MPLVATASAVVLKCHRQNGRTAKPAPTDFDLWPNRDMQPRSAI